MLAGVCSGIGDYIGMDANIVRLLVVLLAVFGGGAGIAIYIAGWLLIPEDGATESIGAQPARQRPLLAPTLPRAPQGSWGHGTVCTACRVRKPMIVTRRGGADKAGGG